MSTKELPHQSTCKVCKGSGILPAGRVPVEDRKRYGDSMLLACHCCTSDPEAPGSPWFETEAEEVKEEAPFIHSYVMGEDGKIYPAGRTAEVDSVDGLK